MKIILLLFLLLSSIILVAQYPILDPTFNSTGYGYIIDSLQSDEALSLKIQTDGKIVLAGYKINSTGDHDVYLARVNSDGTKDNTFHIFTSHINTFSEFTDIAIQNDGKIIATGKTGTLSNGDILVMRFLQDGKIDSTFDNDGILIYDLVVSSNYDDNATCIKIQNNGKILVGGYAEIRSSYDPFVIRLNIDGSFDNTFNGTGMFIRPIPGGSAYIKGMDIQSDGKILMAGAITDTLANYLFACIRINSNGTIDNTFGTAGAFTQTIPGNFNLLRDIIALPSGKILLIGNTSVGSINYAKPILMRLLSDGTLDNDYALFGVSSHSSIPKYLVTENAVIDAQENVYLEGYHMSAPGSIEIGVAKIDSDGVAVNSFGINGFNWFSVGGGSNICHDIALQTDGKIVLAGGYRNNLSTYGDICAIRLSMEGLSISQHEKDNQIAIYPNPSSTTITISHHEPIKLVSLINLYGQVILNIDQINSIEKTFSIEGLSKGTYILKISTQKETITKQMLVE